MLQRGNGWDLAVGIKIDGPLDKNAGMEIDQANCLNTNVNRDKYKEFEVIHQRSMSYLRDASNRLEAVSSSVDQFKTAFQFKSDKEIAIKTVKKNVENISNAMKTILTEVETLESRFIKDQTVQHLHLICFEQLSHLKLLCSALPYVERDGIVFELEEQANCVDSTLNATQLMNDAMEIIKEAVSFQSAKAEKDRLSAVVEGLQEEILIKDTKFNQVLAELEDRCKSMTILMKERDMLAAEQERYDSLDETFKILVEGSDLLQSEIDTLTTKLTSAEDQCKEYENEIKEIVKDKGNISRAMDAVLVERNALANQLKDCQFIIKEISELQFYAQNYEKIASDRDELIVKLKQSEEREKTLEDYKLKYEELSIIEQTLREENENLHTTLQDQQNQLNICQETIKEQSAKVHHLKTNLAAINTEMKNQHLAILNMISESEKKDQQLKKFKEEISNIESLKFDISSMESDLVSSLEEAISQKEILELDIENNNEILKKKEEELNRIHQHLVELFEIKGFESLSEADCTLEVKLVKFISYMKENKLQEKEVKVDTVNSLDAHLEELLKMEGYGDTSEEYCSIEDKIIKYIEYKKENMSHKQEIKVLKLPNYCESGSSINDDNLPEFDKSFDDQESVTGSDVSEVNAERIAEEYKEIQSAEAMLRKRTAATVGDGLFLNHTEFMRTKEAMETVLSAMIAVLVVREYINYMSFCAKTFASSDCKVIEIASTENQSSSNATNIETAPPYNSLESSSKNSETVHKNDSNFNTLQTSSNDDSNKSIVLEAATEIKFTEDVLPSKISSKISLKTQTLTTNASYTVCTDLNEESSSCFQDAPPVIELMNVTPVRRTKSYVIQRYIPTEVIITRLEGHSLENKIDERYPTFYDFSRCEIIKDDISKTKRRTGSSCQSEELYVATSSCIIFSSRSSQDYEYENICTKCKEVNECSLALEENLNMKEITNTILPPRSKSIESNPTKLFDSDSIFENISLTSVKDDTESLMLGGTDHDLKASFSSPELLNGYERNIEDVYKRAADVNGTRLNLSRAAENYPSTTCENNDKCSNNQKESIDTDLKDLDEKLEGVDENTTSTQVEKGISYEKVVEAVIESLAKDSIDIISDYFYKGFVRYNENKQKYLKDIETSLEEQQLPEYNTKVFDENIEFKMQYSDDKSKAFPEILSDIENEVLKVIGEDELPHIDLSKDHSSIKDVANSVGTIDISSSPENKYNKNSVAVQELSNIELMLSVLNNYKQSGNEPKPRSRKQSKDSCVVSRVNNEKDEDTKVASRVLQNMSHKGGIKHRKYGSKLSKRYSGCLIKNMKRHVEEVGVKKCKNKTTTKVFITDNSDVIDGNVASNYVDISKSSGYSKTHPKPNQQQHLLVDKNPGKPEEDIHLTKFQIDEVKKLDNKVTKKYINCRLSKNEPKTLACNTEVINNVTVTKVSKEANKVMCQQNNVQNTSSYVIKSCRRISCNAVGNSSLRKTPNSINRRHVIAQPETYVNEDGSESNSDCLDVRPLCQINKKQEISKQCNIVQLRMKWNGKSITKIGKLLNS